MLDHDPFDRDVYCVLGLPIDAVSINDVVGKILEGIDARKRLFLSTPNLNFLVLSEREAEFRNTVLASDLNVADGMPLLWIARLLRLPIRERVAGSDLLSALESRIPKDQSIRVAFFGGAQGVGRAACDTINEKQSVVTCAGAVDPGFNSIEALSSDETLDEVNAIDADFLVAALGAQKGQIWLHRNTDRLIAPVRSHLGALINMAAGRIQRAPTWMQKAGLEWMWRIKEEPHLWLRYWHDGWVFLRLILTRVVPLAILIRLNTYRASRHPIQIEVEGFGEHRTLIRFRGIATFSDREKIRESFRQAMYENTDVLLDLEEFSWADPGYFGLLLVFKEHLHRQNRRLDFGYVTEDLKRCFKLNGVSFLLANQTI